MGAATISKGNSTSSPTYSRRRQWGPVATIRYAHSRGIQPESSQCVALGSAH